MKRARLLLLLMLAAIPVAGYPPVEIDYFFETGCPECRAVNEQVLSQLEAGYAGQYMLRRWDINIESNFLVLAAYQERLGMEGNHPVSIVIDGREALTGLQAIRAGLLDKVALAIDARLQAEAEGTPFLRPPPIGPATVAEVKGRGARFAPPLVALAGLADGLNPCAFTTIVFLVSLLAVAGRRGRVVLLGGLAFCAASFATYLLIGFGLLAGLQRLQAVAWLRVAIEWTSIGALVVLGVLSLLDAWRYARTGDSRRVLLQLPGGIKRLVHNVARTRMRSPAALGAGFACGAAVTALESVCTGQMYLPTLVLMSREGGTRPWGLLLLYNLMFVVPLLAVFGLSALGVRSQRLTAWTRLHVVTAKLLLAVVFLLLAALFVLQGQTGS